MKIVKRITTCLLVFCLLCGLSACNKPTQTGSDWIWAYNQRGAFSDKGYYFVESGFLRFVDLSSGVSVCLCSKAGCLHDQEPDNRVSESCEAFMPSFFSLTTPTFFWGDNLYYITYDHYGLKVYRRDATGAGLESLTVLGEQYIKNKKDLAISAYAVSNGFFYYSADTNGTVLTEDGTNIVQRTASYIARLDLQTGKEEILVENSDVPITLCAVKGNEMLFHTYGVPDVDFNDPNYREVLLNLPATLQHWDGTSGQTRTLIDKTRREFSGVSMVDGDKIYYSSAADTEYNEYAYDLNTGTQTVVSHDSMHYIGKGYALRFDAKNEQWHLYNLNTGKKLSNALSRENFRAQTISDDGFVMRRTVSNGNGGSTKVLSYVTYASLADGLQERDLMDFFGKSVSTG